MKRIKKFHIHLPPLQERLEDIPLLAEHFYRQAYQQMSRTLVGFAPGVLEMLQRYHWPGNVRELRNGIRQACVLAQYGECIQKHHFSSQIQISPFSSLSERKTPRPPPKIFAGDENEANDLYQHRVRILSLPSYKSRFYSYEHGKRGARRRE